MQSAYAKLEHLFSDMHTLKSCISLLNWDTAVLLPVAATQLRSEQLGYLEAQLHKQLQSKTLACHLDKAEAKSTSLDDWQKANLREMRRLQRLATALPAKLQRQFSKQTVTTESKWRLAKQESRYSLFIDPLERMLDLVRAKAACYADTFKVSPYHGLMLEYDSDVDFGIIDPLFSDLERKLPPLIQAIALRESSTQRARFLGSDKISYPKSMQKSLCKEVAARLGFDFSYGRLDESAHPFTEGVQGDIRITTRYDESNPFFALLGVLHEAGHALYDHNLPKVWRKQPVGRDCGMLIHEGIALLMEMMIGRSEAFSEYLQPIMQKHFKLKDYPRFVHSQLMEHLLSVKLTPIRTDAELVGYIPHILLRYQLEKELLQGGLRAKDIPEQWNKKMHEYFSMEIKDNRQGCLQDIHWSLGLFGYFPSYALGLLMAVSLYRQIGLAIPNLDEAIRKGDFLPILDYLKKMVFSKGAYCRQSELIENICGGPLSSDLFVDYLQKKYSI